ncbi:MAG TPA: potassium channel family protein [Gaiellaceae bacterium]|nr:potassium channel family protein [Gaiellaceae bacterium]
MRLLGDRSIERLNRAVVSGRIIPYLALVTLIVAVVAGVAAWLLAPHAFDDLGDALWWSAATVTTIGYGDVVPATTGGRVVGVFVMMFGVAAVSVITALVTAVFIAYQQRRLGQDAERHTELIAALERVEQRLAALERQR